MIDLDHFAQECVRQGFYFGVNPHYLLGVAKLRSGITNDAVGGAIGPFRLTQAEWDAHRKDDAFDLDFRADDITSRDMQIAVFALMVRRAFDAFEAANDRTPSAIELYHQQFPGAPTPTLSADLGRALDTTAGLVVRAEAGVLATFSEETLIEQLGARATALKLEAGAAGDVAVRANYLVAPAKAVLRGVMGLGKAVLIECVKQLQNLVCGDDPASTEERGKLRDAFGIGQTSGAVLLT